MVASATMLNCLLTQQIFDAGKSYFLGLLHGAGDLSECYEFCKIVHLLSPAYAAFHMVTHTDVRRLFAVPFLSHRHDLLALALMELPDYLTFLENLKADVEAVAWWQAHSPVLPALSETVRLVLTIPTSSAASERVFSQYQKVVSQAQARMLADTREAAVMLRYNYRGGKSTLQHTGKQPKHFTASWLV
jgi:hypothetical protein